MQQGCWQIVPVRAADEPARGRKHPAVREVNSVRLLFVCTGNICRSPTAERLAIAYSRDRFGVDNLEVSSAGTRAVIGQPIHSDAAAVLEELGGDASNFAARQLTSKIASAADLVLTMTRAHRDAVLELAPRQLRKTFTLIEAAQLVTIGGADDLSQLAGLRPRLPANDLLDVTDPIGLSPEVFSSVGAQISDLLMPVLELCERSSG